MKLSTLTALSPLDGRYANKVDALRPYMSEYGLIYFRVLVEIRWLQHLAQAAEITDLRPFSVAANNFLEQIITNFSEHDAEVIKTIEQRTNHDVKAVEYFLREKVASHDELKYAIEYIHFACTSEDINNLSYGLMLQNAREQCLLPEIDELIHTLQTMAHQYANQAMLARTHGQPATPTTVGKEIAVFVERLKRQRAGLSNIAILGKMNGAVGNYNAHLVAYPDVDWPTLCSTFVTKLGLKWNPLTTQIESHDYLAELCHSLIRLNSIIIDLNRDMWSYISLDYFSQKMLSHEVGSSTMPHKINPIDFENSEGNLSLANSLYEFLAARLPISRWQRDLVDSTLLRNLGVAFGHSLLGLQAAHKGLNKLELNSDKIEADLENRWEVITEALQTVMRRYGIENSYDQLKNLSRGKAVNQETLREFIGSLNLPDEVKNKLYGLTPQEYIGLAAKLAMGV